MPARLPRFDGNAGSELVTGAPDVGGFLRIDTSDLKALYRQLRLFSPTLATAMRRNLRRAGMRGAERVREAASAVGSTSIPPAVAVAISFAPKRAAVTVKVAQSKLPPGHEAVARMVEGQLGGRGYRHPVYGNTEVWVTQHPTPYFRQTLAAEQARVTVEVLAAMDEATRAVARGVK